MWKYKYIERLRSFINSFEGYSAYLETMTKKNIIH